MSSSRRAPRTGTDFDAWIASRFGETRGFTAVILLLSIGDDRIEPISCAYVHVVGDEVTWRDMRAMLDASRRRWDGVAIFVEAAPGGGPVIDIVAKARMQERIDEVTMNRMALNDAGLFDSAGRAIRIDPVEVH